MFYTTEYISPIGKLTLASDEKGEKLIGLWIEGQKYYKKTILDSSVEEKNVPVFERAEEWLEAYFMGEKPEISDLLLEPSGSEFQQDVWNILCAIPYGKVTTYKDIALKIANKRKRNSMSSQAIGGAVGRNPISIIIPCHRVVGSNGNLTGYAAGIETKIELLKLEGVDLSQLNTF